ncbi:hypothetical protein WN943_021282 [Citrus x changshan-huyou]
MLVRRSRPRLVVGSARDRRLAAACAVGTAGISRLAIGTARVWLLELLAFGCCLCSRLVAALACGISRLAAACARFWLMLLLVESRMVDQSSQNLNTHLLYSFEQEDDEAYWSNDDNEDITPADDEGVDVGHIESCEEVDYEDSEEEDRILSNCESDDREHGLLSDLKMSNHFIVQNLTLMK